MQFGLDQDIPALVPRTNNSHESAWSNYTRWIGDKKLYLPARLNESGVTVRYSTWWGRAMSAKVDNIKSFVRKPRSKTRKKAPRACWGLRYKDEEKVDPLTANENAVNSKIHSAIVNNIENKNSTSGGEDPLTADENVSSSKIHSAIISNTENKNSTSGDMDTPGLDIEHRISKLEILASSRSADVNTQAIVEVDQRLLGARRLIRQSGVRKVPLNRWIKLFQGNENGYGDLEHVAFLIFWLSKFVFPKRSDVVGKHVHAIAIRLAMGVRIALAPAVLASIYRDLRILKSAISSVSAVNPAERKVVELEAPMHLVQIWAWERFPGLMLRSNPIEPSQQIMARWHSLSHSLPEPDIDLVIESGAICFSWRPYASFCGNHELIKSMYKNGEQWVLGCSELDDDVEALVKFVRPSELVGLGCIEQYLPHRVARQFGFDQDLPGPVSRHNQNYDAAWADYNRPIGDQILYIPPRIVKTEVTTRYLAWWNQSKSVVEA